MGLLMRIFYHLVGSSGLVVWLSACGNGTEYADSLPLLFVKDVAMHEGTLISDESCQEKRSVCTKFPVVVKRNTTEFSSNITFSSQTIDGTAQAPDDYIPLVDSLSTLNIGRLDTSFFIYINGDVEVEDEEYFMVKITNIKENGDPRMPASYEVKITIINDDVGR